MNKNIIIIGARHFGREVFNLLNNFESYGISYKVKGFLDDNFDALSNFCGYPEIISSVEDYIPQENDVFICALGGIEYKKKYIDIIKSKGGNFISVIHPTCVVYKDVEIGEGVLIGPYCIISCNVVLKDFVSIQAFANLGHDANVGEYSILESYSFLGGCAKIGDRVTIHTGAKILPHKFVADYAIVGAGSIVIRNVKEGKTVFGNPAIEMRI